MLYEYTNKEIDERCDYLLKKIKNLNSRSKYYSLILYTESCDSDFQNYLRSENIGYVLSPLHNKDVNENGEIKKHHYHLILVYNSLKSLKQVLPVASSIGGINVNIQRVENIKGTFRYLTHLDDSDKAQYDFNDVVQYGVDFSHFLISDFNTNDYFEMFNFVRQNKVYYMCDFLEYCQDYKMEWYLAILENPKYNSTLKEYMKSALYKQEKLASMGLKK